jgi:methionyl aminopeptidase
MVTVKTKPEQASMRRGGQILASVLEELSAQLQPGMTTLELDQAAMAALKRQGATAAFLGHEGFSKSICTSINEQVVHGIPGQYVLQDGDLVGLDFGVRFEGLITDGAVTVALGAVSKEAQRLLKVTEEALMLGIDQARSGGRIGDVSAAIERHLRAGNLGIIKELAGHGVGYNLWEDPHIPNLGSAGTGPTLKPGMTVAIEPMAALGRPDIKVLQDGWTIVTQDGSLAAQFEHTVLITERGPAEILTQA